jgi:hypothetical protein
MTTADWALLVSIGSLCVALSGFVLKLARWFGEGVKLSMTVMAGAKLYGGEPHYENTYLAITVTNRGTAATTITHMILYNYPDRLSLFLSECPLFVISKSPRFVRRWLKRHSRRLSLSTPSECRRLMCLNPAGPSTAWPHTCRTWRR